MKFEITAENYRCYTQRSPMRISFSPGFTGIIGVNNSGKSAALKFFFEFRNFFFAISHARNELVQALKAPYQNFAAISGVVDTQEVFNDRSTDDLVLTITVSPDISDEVVIEGHTVTTVTATVDHQLTWQLQLKCGATPIITKDPNLNIVNGHMLQFTEPNTAATRAVDLAFLFKGMEILGGMLYIGPFRNAINVGGQQYYDIEVGQAFIGRWQQYAAGGNRAQARAVQRVIEDLEQIFGYERLEIHATPDNSLQITVDRQVYRLEEMGSGLSQFILVFATALIKNATYLLIDEPELGLHPSLQLAFLTRLADYSQQRGIIFATHNLGLARTASDALFSIRVTQRGREFRRYEETTSLPELLGELSYSGWRELGFSAVLLVEGITDVKTYQQFLKKLKLDTQVVIIPLGGDQFLSAKYETELAELARLSDDIFCIIDSEKASQTAAIDKLRLKFQADCQALGINCHITERRATENYFSDQIVKDVLGPKFAALTEFQSFHSIALQWGKSQNWKLAAAMTLGELQATDVGEFLAEIQAASTEAKRADVEAQTTT